MRRGFLLSVIMLISSCATNIRCVDYMIVTKKDGVKHTIEYNCWDIFEMDQSKMERMLMSKGIGMEDVQVIDFIQGPRSKSNKHY